MTGANRGAASRGVSVVAVLGAVGAVTVVVLGLMPAVWAGAGPLAAASPAAPVGVELVDQATWVHAGDEFTVDVRVSGAPADAAIQLVVHDRLLSRTAFQRTLEGDLGGTVLTLDPAPLAELAPGRPPASLTTGFVVGPAAGHGLDGRGVYPVDVRVVDAQGTVLTHVVTHLIYLPEKRSTGRDPYTPLDVAVVVDVSAPPALQPDGSVSVSPTTQERARERVGLLTNAADVPLTVAPQPETLDGLADSGRQGAATVKALTQATGTRPVLARPYTDVDLAALRQAGLVAEANDQAEAGADVVRSRFGKEPLPGIWLSGATLGADAARQAVDLGIDRAIVPPTAVEEQSGSAAGPVPDAPVTVGDGGPLVMVSDDDLTTRLMGDSGVLDAQHFLAELAIMWFERPAIPRAVVVRIPGDAALDVPSVARALNGLTDGQAVRAVTIDRVFATVQPIADDGPTTVDPTRHDVTDDLAGVAASLTRARAAVNGVAGTVNKDTAARASSLPRSLLLATGSATPNGQRAAYVERVTRELGTLSKAIDLPDKFRITLTSRTSTIPVNITNRSDRPLTVRVVLDSSQLEFLDGKVITRELQPGGTRLDVRVRSLTSGAFPLDITVTSPDGSIVLDQSTFDIRSTAVTGVGLVLSIGAGLFLAVWWARHWRKARRSRHLMPAGSVPPSPPPSGELDDAEEGYRPAHMAGHRSHTG